MPIYCYTDRQKEIEKLINKQGFGTKMEVPADQYCIDILVPELDDLIVEVIGPQHYKRELQKRETYLKEFLGYKYFLYVPVQYTDTEFLELLNKRLGEWFGTGLKGYIKSSK
jgi:hypothetical protein